jgi:hypothetical protein
MPWQDPCNKQLNASVPQNAGHHLAAERFGFQNDERGGGSGGWDCWASLRFQWMIYNRCESHSGTENVELPEKDSLLTTERQSICILDSIRI